jgi:hypothetical protein
MREQAEPLRIERLIEREDEIFRPGCAVLLLLVLCLMQRPLAATSRCLSCRCEGDWKCRFPSGARLQDPASAKHVRTPSCIRGEAPRDAP